MSLHRDLIVLRDVLVAGAEAYSCLCTLFKCLRTRVSSKKPPNVNGKKMCVKVPPTTHTCVTVYALDPICACMYMHVYVLCLCVCVCLSKSFSTCSATSLPSRQGDMRIEPSASLSPRWPDRQAASNSLQLSGNGKDDPETFQTNGNRDTKE